MNLDFFLHNSTVTPLPPEYDARVALALEEVGAVHGDGPEVRLCDGSSLELFTDTDDDIALLRLSTLNDEVLRAIYALVERTGSFLLSDTLDAGSITTPGHGGEPPSSVFPGVSTCADFEAFKLSFTAEYERRLAIAEREAQVQARLDEVRARLAAEPAATAYRPTQPPRRSVGKWLSDLLFGRAI